MPGAIHINNNNNNSVLPLNQSIRSPRYQEGDEYRTIQSWRRRIMVLSTILTVVTIIASHNEHGYYAETTTTSIEQQELLNAPNVFTPRTVQNAMRGE